MKGIYFLSAILLLASCGTTHNPSYSSESEEWDQLKPSEGKKILHSLYLVGDTGELDDAHNKTNRVLEALKKDLAKETGESSLVFLGDNIYPYGMPAKGSPTRVYAEDIINAQLDCSSFHQGETYFIPGNHDWNKHKSGGRKAILRQEKYIKSYNKEKPVHFYPKNACGDPKVIKINKDLVFVFLDTQWWLHNWSGEKEMNTGCDLQSRGDLIKRMGEIFTKYKNDEIVVMMHHPVYTDGTHGGKFGIKQHLFPLQAWKHNLYIPLPIIGSLYPAYRTITGSKQDNTNTLNKELVQGINNLAIKLNINVLFAAGHDHGLQYFDKGKLKYIVSGAGGKADYIANGRSADYARSARGYVRVDFYEDFEAHATFFVVEDNEHPQSEIEFKTLVRAPRAGTVTEEHTYNPVTQKTTTLPASNKFNAGPLKKIFLGDQYRDLWATPVQAITINLESKYGGLIPIKKGGGMASNSLRLQHQDGRQYILRSIKKDYTKLVPPEFVNLRLLEVLADQNSASHPYGALILPSLSEAANIYYTTPKLVYLQHQRGLGNYNSQFNEELYLLEERPKGDWSDYTQFGNSDKIIGYTDLLEILRTKKNHYVDQKWVLKSRIFDLWIHDWDRHDDQWRWARFKKEGKNIYRPIPRDRDQAFYKFKGVVPWYVASFIQKKLKTMKGDVKDAKHLSFNAKNFDRFFLNELTWDQWEDIIRELQNNLTDEVIKDAIKAFPSEIQDLPETTTIANLLKERRENLMKIGRRLYDFLSEEVEIVGSDDENYFDIEILDKGAVSVMMYVIKDNEKFTKFERVFDPKETKELRLYGRGDDDHFSISGTNKSKIKISIIGGAGEDQIDNKTNTKIFVYDNKEGISTTGSIIDKTSTDIEVSTYDRESYRYDTNLPFLTLGYTLDDGTWFGGGVSWTNHSWRKDPFQAKQRVSASFAPGSRGTLLLSYEGHFPDIINQVDFKPKFSVDFPFYENYFGLGAQAENDLSRGLQFNWVRMQAVESYLGISLFSKNHFSFDIGPLYQFRNISVTDGRVSTDDILGFSSEELEFRHYLGGELGYRFDYKDNKIFTTNGVSLSASLRQLYRISELERVTEITTNASIHFRLANKPLIVMATQVGFEKSFGDLQFFHYPALGNTSGLRGWRNERWRGQSAFYHNVDLRIHLFNWKNNILPMGVGMVLGYDYGRVHLDNEPISPWRNSATLGLWLQPLGTFIIHPYYSFNTEQNTFSLRLGFNF